MTTVYEHFKAQADKSYTNARNALTANIAQAYADDGELWERRAGMLTLEEGQADVADICVNVLVEETDLRVRGIADLIGGRK